MVPTDRKNFHPTKQTNKPYLDFLAGGNRSSVMGHQSHKYEVAGRGYFPNINCVPKPS